MDLPCAADRGGHRGGEHRAGPPGQARTLLSYAGEAEGAGRDEDDLAFLRDEREFRNVQLVEIPGGDFAVTIARQLIFAGYQYELYRRLLGSADPTLAGLAAKAVKEVAYHRDHATQWVLWLGDGTGESHRRMQGGLDRTWPYADELFESALDLAVLGGVAVDRPSLQPAWIRLSGPSSEDSGFCGAALGQPAVRCRWQQGVLDLLTDQDTVAFTGSASTAAAVRSHPVVHTGGVRFSSEADSLNFSVLGVDVQPGHGGPGRAGGGEELGGIRSMLHYMQRTAVQGSPRTVTAVTGTWLDHRRAAQPRRAPVPQEPGGTAVGDAVERGPPRRHAG